LDSNSRIFVAGHRGLVGSALVRCLKSKGYTALLLRERAALDLTQQHAVEAFFAATRPEYVFLAAAKVGGILANSSRPAEFLFENLAIQTNVIQAAYRHGVKKLLFLGSSCIYPRDAPQPLKEHYLLSGPLEPTNEWYAIAKIAGLKMCQAYRRQYRFDAIALMPTNLYGPADNFSPEQSHVLPALIRRFHDAVEHGAREVEIWGTGRPQREFLHIDDLAEACLFLMHRYAEEAPINVGWGVDISIGELARLIAQIVGFDGQLRFNPDKPDGTPRKVLDTSKLTALGWQPRIRLAEGIRDTYQWYRRSLERVDA
jgi:GDP-L-fucose synthase